MTVTLKRPAVTSGVPFDLVWTSYPGLQNRSSSTWWYFLFCPEQEGGYGPKPA